NTILFSRSVIEHHSNIYPTLSQHVKEDAHTSVPHDMTAQRGQDVEMACSFRGAGTPSYSLEIQWWYIRNHADWTDKQPWTTNEPIIRLVVKVVGSNISHKLRLSRVKPSDEGIYECRVIDFSDIEGARHHRVRAYLQVVPESEVIDSTHHDNFEALDDTKEGVPFKEGDGMESHRGTKEHAHGHHQNHGHHQENGKRPSSPTHHGHSHSGSGQQHKAGRELRKRDVDSNHNNNDCSNEPSCAL
uniref:V-set and transmembrane domain-containing protein 2-like protein n=1 Tax=Labrus bergylta TaxID=56723 RepID=A0A3Q3MM27_9LABR